MREGREENVLIVYEYIYDAPCHYAGVTSPSHQFMAN